MYSKIHNPKTNRNVSINTTLGKKILKSYLKKLGISGGAEPDPDTLFASLLNKRIGLNHLSTTRALALHDFRIGDRVQATNLQNQPIGFILAEPRAGWFTVILDGYDDVNQVWHRNLVLQRPRAPGERERHAFQGPAPAAAPLHGPRPHLNSVYYHPLTPPVSEIARDSTGRPLLLEDSSRMVGERDSAPYDSSPMPSIPERERRPYG